MIIEASEANGLTIVQAENIRRENGSHGCVIIDKTGRGGSSRPDRALSKGHVRFRINSIVGKESVLI